MLEAGVRSPLVDRGRVASALQNYGVYVAIVVLVVIDTALASGFLSVDNLKVQLFQAVPVLVVALVAQRRVVDGLALGAVK